jgi:hypothetical protein
MTRLLRLTGDDQSVGLQAKEAGQQSDRLVLNVPWEALKLRPGLRRMKERQLRDSRSGSGLWHQHLLRRSRKDAVLVTRRREAPSAKGSSIPPARSSPQWVRR